MKMQRDVWYIGFQCDGCRTFQAIMEDPDKGKPGTRVPVLTALNPVTGQMESADSPQGIATQCESCHQPNVIRIKDMRRRKGPDGTKH